MVADVLRVQVAPKKVRPGVFKVSKEVLGRFKDVARD